MSARYRCGLVVGKFCPLHRGHELVIAQALACCDEVLVISYTKPGFPGYGCAQREAWLQSRFPGTLRLVIDDARLATLCRDMGIAGFPSLPADDAPDIRHREFVARLCIDVLHKRADAVFTSEDYGDGFAAVLTEEFRQVVRHVCVDKARLGHPISGTQIRADPHRHRHHMDASVYASFVRRICILGGECSGKTTLAQDLAAALDTVWVAEYGRELWERKDGRLTYDDMLAIGLAQVEREEALLPQAHRFLVCDTSPLTTMFYSQAMFGRVEPALARLAGRSYDLVLLCAPEFDFVQDGTRRDSDFRARQHQWYLEQFTSRGTDFFELFGVPAQRLKTAVAHIEHLGMSRRTGLEPRNEPPPFP